MAASAPSTQLRSIDASVDSVADGAAAVASLTPEAFEDLLSFMLPGLQIDQPAADAVPLDAPIADQVDAWASKHGLKAKPAKGAAKLLVSMRQGAIRNVLPASALQEDAVALGFPPSHIEILAKAWQSRGLNLCSVAALSKNPTGSGSLVDSQWRFGVTASTDDVNRVGTTFVQLKVRTPAKR